MDYQMEDVGALDLAQLVERLEELNEHRTPVGWSPEDAALKAHIERRIMELVAGLEAPADERRRTMRVPCDMPVRIQSRERTVEARACDIGPGGVFVHTRSRIEPGAPVDLELGHATRGVRGPRVRAVVAWVHPGSEGAEAGIGLEFRYLDREGDERRMRRFVLELLRHRMQVH